MNQTPKQKVLAVYPQAKAELGGILGDVWRIIDESKPERPIISDNVKTSQAAWKSAAEQLDKDEMKIIGDARKNVDSGLPDEMTAFKPTGDLWDDIPKELPPNHYEDTIKATEQEISFFVDPGNPAPVFDEVKKAFDKFDEDFPHLKTRPAAQTLPNGKASQLPKRRKVGPIERRRIKNKCARKARKVNRQKAKR